MIGLNQAPLAIISDETEVAPAAPEVDFRALAEFMPQAMLVLGEGRAVRYANAAAENLLRTSFTQMEDKSIEQFLILDQDWEKLMAQVPAQQQSITGRNLSLQLPRGVEAQRVKLNLVALPDKPNCLMQIELQDSAGWFENQANQEKTMQSAAVMAHILAHEVRNPLSGIRGAAQLLQHDADESNQELVGLICSEVDRISSLLNEVEYFSETRSLAVEPVNIHEVLRHVRTLAEQGQAQGVVFKESFDPSLPLVMGSRERLVQALLNLIKNAAEAVKASGVEAPEITLKTMYRGGYKRIPPNGTAPVSLPVCVMIGDNGPGIAEELRNQIFDPFVTAGKIGGKGLGLPVVAKIIADHGAVLALEHAEAGNTVFAMQLPAVSEKVASEKGDA